MVCIPEIKLKLDKITAVVTCVRLTFAQYETRNPGIICKILKSQLNCLKIKLENNYEISKYFFRLVHWEVLLGNAPMKSL